MNNSKNVSGSTVRTRPSVSFTPPKVSNGIKNGRIESVVFSEGKLRPEDEEGEIITITVSIEELGKIVNLSRRFYYYDSWSTKSTMYKTLDDLGRLPKENEVFDFASLVGMIVTATIKNKKSEKNGLTYPNITQLLPRETINETANIEDLKLEILFDNED